MCVRLRIRDCCPDNWRSGNPTVFFLLKAKKSLADYSTLIVIVQHRPPVAKKAEISWIQARFISYLTNGVRPTLNLV